MSTKEIVMRLIESLPDDVTLEEVARDIEFIAGVREGFESYEKEGGINLEEVRRNVTMWAMRGSEK